MHINVSPLELERLRSSGQLRVELLEDNGLVVSEIVVLVNYMDQNDREPVRITDVDINENRTVLTVEN